MLSREDNELLTQTDAGTPMGDYMRRFWLPVAASAEIAVPDAPPIRVRLLGERLILFRTSDGRIGLTDEHCPHRRTSLYFGRNEENGIRCVYHGWKFDVEGRCVDMPNEPASSSFRNKVRLRSFPTIERGGVVWGFIGPAEARPRDLPAFEWLNLPAERRFVSRWIQDCNYAQAMEGELDSSHVSFLHRRIDRLAERSAALTGSFFQQDRAPVWKVMEADHGLVCASHRTVDDGQWYWRMNQWLAPFYTMIAPLPGDARMTRAWIPADDEHCSVVCVSFRPDRDLDPAEVASWQRGEVLHRRLVPGTTTPVETMANDYLIDRERQRTVSFTGIEGVRAQDAMAAESAGPIVDRTREHLGQSDIAIIAMRRRLLAAAKAMRDGREPRQPHNPAVYRVRAAQSTTASGVEPDRDPALKAMMAVP